MYRKLISNFVHKIADSGPGIRNQSTLAKVQNYAFNDLGGNGMVPNRTAWVRVIEERIWGLHFVVYELRKYRILKFILNLSSKYSWVNKING